MKKILIKIWMWAGIVSFILLICFACSDFRNLLSTYFYNTEVLEPTILFKILFIIVGSIFLAWLFIGIIFEKQIKDHF